MGWLVLALVFMLAITVGYGLRRFYRRWVWGRTHALRGAVKVFLLWFRITLQ
jgi:hypothetical protein